MESTLLRPKDMALLLLASGDLLPRQRARDQQADISGSALKARILNELVSNCLKYAFPDARPGEILVALRCEDGDRVTLRIADNGIGLPSGLDWRQSQSLGLRIVNILARPAPSDLKSVLTHNKAGQLICWESPKPHTCMNLVETGHADYQSYMLRVWRDDARRVWHASLQSTTTKQIHHFADAESLLKFLAARGNASNSPTATTEEQINE